MSSIIYTHIRCIAFASDSSWARKMTKPWRSRAGPGPGPVHAGINSYSAQEGVNSKGNMIDVYIYVYIYILTY